MTVHPSRHSTERLNDVLNAVVRTKRAELQLTTTEEADDEVAAGVALDAVLYNLVIIGEAVNALPPTLTAKEPDVPWRDIVDMRNFLAHQYFHVLTDVIRRTIDEPLEQLRTACERLLATQRQPARE